MAKSAHRTMRDFIADTAFAGVATTMTLWYRLPMFALTSLMPPAARRAEAMHMVDEKAAAVAEGAFAANMEALRIVGAAMTGRISPRDLGAAPVAIAAAGLRPGYRRVRANARRLNNRALRGK